MKKIKYFFLLALIAVIAGCGQNNQEQGLDFVLDCSDYLKPCELREAEQGEKNQKITLIADEGNQIPSPFTKENYIVENIDVELHSPWDIEFLPDGSIIITQKNGEIVYIKDGDVYKEKFPASNLFGLAIDPNFSTNNFIYVYYVYALDFAKVDFFSSKQSDRQKTLSKISRLTFNNGILSDETVLLDKISGSTLHLGGRLEFGPDGKLYATTGDSDIFEDTSPTAENIDRLLLAQDISSSAGKILRLNTDGSVPKDNPFPNSYVYSYGHRNPQGLAWHPESGELYASEHGSVRYDEINRILPGKNYGWGVYKCDEYEDWVTEEKKEKNIPPSSTTFPVVCTKTWTIAPSGIEFVTDPDSPWYKSLFVTSLRGKHLHRYEFEDDNVVTDEIFHVNKEPVIAEGKQRDYLEDLFFRNEKDQAFAIIGNSRQTGVSRRLRDVEYFDGSLYVIGDFYGLIKITPR